MRDRALVILCLTFCLRPLSGHALLPFLAEFLFLLSILYLAHLSRYMPGLCVSPPKGFSSPTLHRAHLSSPPACRICCLLMLVHLQTARFPRRCPETGQNSTASGFSLRPITTNAVCSLRHRRRPYPVVACVGAFPGTINLGRVAVGGRQGRSNIFSLRVENERAGAGRDG